MSQPLPEWLQEYLVSLSETHDVFINGTDVMILKKQPERKKEPER